MGPALPLPCRCDVKGKSLSRMQGGSFLAYMIAYLI
jgi:hypothetical protein